MAERLTVDQEVVGSTPISLPRETANAVFFVPSKSPILSPKFVMI